MITKRKDEKKTKKRRKKKAEDKGGGGESTLQKHMEPMELFLGGNVENEYIKKMKKKKRIFKFKLDRAIKRF